MSAMRCPGGADAIPSPTVSRLGRLVIAISAFLCVSLITTTLTALRASDWTIFTGGAMVVLSIAVVIATLHLWTESGDGPPAGSEHGSDEGEGGPRRHRPDAPQPGGGENDPTWWPEFERQLAFYLAEREREERRPAVNWRVSR